MLCWECNKEIKGGVAFCNICKKVMCYGNCDQQHSTQHFTYFESMKEFREWKKEQKVK